MGKLKAIVLRPPAAICNKKRRQANRGTTIALYITESHNGVIMDIQAVTKIIVLIKDMAGLIGKTLICNA